jgi:hypothetical protein
MLLSTARTVLSSWKSGYRLRQRSPNASIYVNSVRTSQSCYRGLCGANRMRKFLSDGPSAFGASYSDMVGFHNSPCHRTLYRKSTTTSLSIMPMLLKCFRTELASCSLLWRRSSFRLAIVGDNFPIAERESTS